MKVVKPEGKDGTVPSLDMDAPITTIYGLDLDELRAAIAIADYYRPDWLDEFRRTRSARRLMVYAKIEVPGE